MRGEDAAGNCSPCGQSIWPRSTYFGGSLTEPYIDHHQHRYLKKPDMSKLWVISVVSNPVRYKSRYRLMRKYQHHMDRLCRDAGANHFICEMAFGDREFEIVTPGQSNTLALRTETELWHKEQMINLSVRRLPFDWQYVCWVDADLEFTREDILEETWHQLQHHHVIQMWSHAVDLGPNNDLMATHSGFMYLHVIGKLSRAAYADAYEKKQGREFGHPGYAWAATRQAWDQGFLNGLPDYCIVGSADHNVARALLGHVDDSIPKNVTCPYLNKLKLWEANCVANIRYDVGYVPGTLLHAWHGAKRHRGYVDRWRILVDNKFDPDLDLKLDHQGLYMLTDRNPKLRDDLRRYYRSRNEDSIDV